MRLKVIHDRPHLKKALDQLEVQTHILDQRTSIETGNVQSLDLVTGLGHFLHFHFAYGTHKKDMAQQILLLQGIGNSNSREDMPPCSTACYDESFRHFKLPLRFRVLLFL